MYIHRTEIADVICSPYGFQQLIAAVYLAHVGHKEIQQIKFLYGKVYMVACYIHVARADIDGNIPNRYNQLCRLPACPRPAENILYACLYLKDIEGLCHVVVRAVFKAQNLIHILALCGKHYNGHIADLAHRLAYFNAAHFGQHHIQQYKVIIPGFYLGQGKFSVPRGVGFVAVGLQRKFKALYNEGLVVNQQYTLCHMRSSLMLRRYGYTTPMVKIISYYSRFETLNNGINCKYK